VGVLHGTVRHSFLFRNFGSAEEMAIIALASEGAFHNATQKIPFYGSKDLPVHITKFVFQISKQLMKKLLYMNYF
jgi:hypothetical protein